MSKPSSPDSPRRQTPGAGRTERARGGEREPRLPHERDESADSQASRGPTAGVPDAADIGEQAFKDVTSGQQDTGRAPVTDAIYERQREPDDRAAGKGRKKS